MERKKRIISLFLILIFLLGLISAGMPINVRAVSAMLTASDFVVESSTARNGSEITTKTQYGDQIIYTINNTTLPYYQIDGLTSIWRHNGAWWSRVCSLGENQAAISDNTPYYSLVNNYWAGMIADGGGYMEGYWGWGKYGTVLNKHNVTDCGTSQDNGSGKEGIVSIQNYYFNEYLPTEKQDVRVPLPKEVAALMESGVKITPVLYVCSSPGDDKTESIIGFENVVVSDFLQHGDASNGEPGKYSFQITCHYPKIAIDKTWSTTLDYMTNGVKANGSYNSEYTMMVNGFERFNAHFSAFPGAIPLNQSDFANALKDLSLIDATTGRFQNGVTIKGTNRIASNNSVWSDGGAIGIGLHAKIIIKYYAGSDAIPKAVYTYINEDGEYIDPNSGSAVSKPTLIRVPTETTQIGGAEYWDAHWEIPKTPNSKAIISITSIENSGLLGSKYAQIDPGRTVETSAILGPNLIKYKEKMATINAASAHTPDTEYPVFTDASKTGSTKNNYYNYANTDSVLYKVMVSSTPTTPTNEPVFWANSPKAYAEVKQGMYSDNRATESWEAMAGVPHDETLYVNAGASAILMAVSRTTAISTQRWEQTNDLSNDPSLKSQATSGSYHYSASAGTCSVASSRTHCSAVCDGNWCHGCTLGACHNGCGTNHPIPCSHYVPPSGTPGEPGYSPGYYQHTIDGYYDYGAHHNCNAGSCSDSTISSSKPISQFSLYYYGIDSYKYYQPESFTLNSSYFPSSKSFDSVFSVDSSQLNASMTIGNNAKAFTYNTCAALKANFTSDVDNHYKNEARPTAAFTPQKFTISDINGNKYDFLGTEGLTFTGSYDTAAGTVVYTNDINGHKMNSSRVGNDSKHLYADEVPDYAASRTNWLPHVEKWDVNNKVPVRGYAGNPASTSRNTGGTLFYGAGYSLKSLLENGRHNSLASPVEWRLYGAGGANVNKLPSFDTPTVFRPSNTMLESIYSKNSGYAISGSYTEVPNPILVHSPVALGDMSVTDLLLPEQDRIDPGSILSHESSVLDQTIRLGQSFKVNWNHQWTTVPRMSERGILELDARTWGNSSQGYYNGLDTLRWVSSKYIRFSVEVIYKGNRYKKNAWITIPKTELVSTFHVPISNGEDVNGHYEAKVIALNAPAGTSADSSDVEAVMNITRTNFRAKHGANRTFLTSVLGTIGNFAIQYTTDPNWKDYFSSKYTGTGRNMFGFASNYELGRFLDPFNTIPLLNKAPASSKPLIPGNNGNKNNEPIKMGYPIYYSVQTVGNYKDCTMRVDANYRVVQYSEGNTSYIDVDLYYRDGNSYKKLFPNADGSFVTTNILNNSTYPVTGLEQSNSISWGGISFGSGDKTNILGPAFFKLPALLRTLIGYNRDYTYTTQYPSGGEHSLKQHAENAQRWHGVINLPSSTVAVPRGTPVSDSSIIKGDGIMLTCELKFTTEGGSPFNLSTNENTMYTPSPGKVTATVIPPGSTSSVEIDFPVNTVVVFDLAKNASQDAGTPGTH